MTLALIHIALGFGLGVVFGYVHFTSLERVTRLFVARASLWRAAGLQIARLAALATLMVSLAILGAGVLLAGLLGVILARAIVLHRVRKEA